MLSLAGYDPVRRDILTQGFTFGFDLGFRGRPNSVLNVKNLTSCSDYPEAVDRAIDKEVQAGRFLGPLEQLPFDEFQINPVGLVPKKAPGEFRMITNLSSPRGQSINDGILDEFVHISYSTLEDAVRLICKCGPSPFLAKLDIKHAFRLIPIKPSQHNLLCFRWRDKFFIDRCLPMGARSSSHIFNLFSSSIHFLAKQLGVMWLIHYLDDFLLISPSRVGCVEYMNIFIGILNELGVPIAVEKTLGPLQCIEFLGYLIDILNGEIRLPADKLQRCRDLIRSFLGREKCKVRKVQSLAGLLNFACGVVVPGRAFLARLYNLTRGHRNPEHSVRLTAEVKKDLEVWLDFLTNFNGVSIFREQLFLSPDVVHIYTDASGSLGCGGVFERQWFAIAWPSEWWSSQNITFLELVPIWVAIKVWGSELRNKYVVLHTDNQALAYCINKLTSKESRLMGAIRQIVRLLLAFNVKARAEHIAGSLNSRSDALSRLQLDVFRRLHPEADRLPVTVPSLQDLLN